MAERQIHSAIVAESARDVIATGPVSRWKNYTDLETDENLSEKGELDK
jgi:hypothetical protein